MQWIKDGVVLVESDMPDHIRISPMASGMGSKLKIFSVNLDDAGNYTCSVTNSDGNDFMVESLEVRGMYACPGKVPVAI